MKSCIVGLQACGVGGAAELTIQYTNYQITLADPVGKLPALEATESADTSRAQGSADQLIGLERQHGR